jgi:hypothetical protein
LLLLLFIFGFVHNEKCSTFQFAHMLGIFFLKIHLAQE